MALLNPVYGLITCFLVVVTMPIAILAGVTTSLAFTVLMCRVVVAYIELALNVVPQYLVGHPTPGGYSSLITSSSSPVASGQATPSPTHSSRALAGRSSRRRRTSIASVTSVGSITSIDDSNGTTKRSSFLRGGLSSSSGMDRDYEGVGGWRIDDRNDDDWAQINSRLELPSERTHHHRSPSGTTTPGGDWLTMKSGSEVRGRERKEKEKLAMSPNSSRIRTPTRKDPLIIPQGFTTMDGADSYFPPVSPILAKKQAS